MNVNGQQPVASDSRDTPSQVLASGKTARRLVRFSGKVAQPSGCVSPCAITFTLYRERDDTSGLWTETQNVEGDAEGRYSVLLGATQPDGLPLNLFASGDARWLGARVLAAGEIEQPRVLLVAVPYALKAADAETLGGKPLSAFMLMPEAGSPAPAAARPGEATTSAAAVLAAQGPGIKATNGVGYIPVLTDPLSNSSMYDTGGWVGIGTITPGRLFDANMPSDSNQGYQLSIAQSEAGSWTTQRVANEMYAGGETGRMVIRSSGRNMILGPTTAHYVAFGTNSSERMRIDSAGNAGIGTTSPLGRLDIQGATNPTLGGRTVFDDLSYDPRIRQYRWSGGGSNYYSSSMLTTGNAADHGLLQFKVSAGQALIGSESLTTVMSLEGGTGNVGIGTTAPASKLSVLFDGSSGATGAQINVDSPNVATVLSLTNSGAAIGSGSYWIKTGGVSPFAVRGDGNVGIGTTSPEAANKLQVAGNLKVAGAPNVNYIEFPDGTKQYTACGALAFAAPGGGLQPMSARGPFDGLTPATAGPETIAALTQTVRRQEEQIAELRAAIEAVRSELARLAAGRASGQATNEAGGAR